MGRTTRGLAFVRNRGLESGARGDGRWLGIGLAAGALRWIIRTARRKEEVVYRHELRPGERLVIDGRSETFGDLGEKRPY